MSAVADHENPSPPLNTQEVAAILRVHVVTVRMMLERGDLPGTKIAGRWYIPRESLDARLAGGAK